MPFDPAGHGLLSAEAAALSAGPLAAQARLAEDLLDVVPADYDALEADSTEQRCWEEMVVLQINFQFARSEALVQQGLGDLQQTYRKVDAVSPTALSLRDRFFGRGETSVDTFDVDGGSFFLDAITDA